MKKDIRVPMIQVGCFLWMVFFALLGAKGFLFPGLSWWIVFLPLYAPFIAGLIIPLLFGVILSKENG